MNSCNPEITVKPSACSRSAPCACNIQRLSNPKTVKRKKEDNTNEGINFVKKVIDNNPVKNMIAFLREEADKNRKHKMELMQIMPGSQQQMRTYPQFPIPSQMQPHPQMPPPPQMPLHTCIKCLLTPRSQFTLKCQFTRKCQLTIRHRLHHFLISENIHDTIVYIIVYLF